MVTEHDDFMNCFHRHLNAFTFLVTTVSWFLGGVLAGDTLVFALSYTRDQNWWMLIDRQQLVGRHATDFEWLDLE